MSGDDLSSWIEEAIHRQQDWQEIMGDIHELETNNMLFLKKKVGFAMFGHPATLPSYENDYTGYNKGQLESIKQIIINILNNRGGNKLFISFILLVIKLEDDSSNVCQEIVLRVQRDRNNSDSVFIDRHSRIYNTWLDFEKENLLPRCIYCYPEGGYYRQNFMFTVSPACSFAKVAIDKLDSFANFASQVTNGAVAAGSFVTLAPAIATTATVGAVGLGVYSTIRAVSSLFDRKTHGQSISVVNQEARQSWLNIGVSGLAGVGGAVFSRIQRIASSGGEISKASIRTMRTVNAATVVVSSISTLDSVFYYKEKYDNRALTPQDLYNLSCEIVFFFNTISLVKATNNLISVMESTRVTPNSTVKLTKSMKRRLKKRRAVNKQKLLSAACQSHENFQTILKRIAPNVLLADPNLGEVMNTICCLGHDLRSIIMGTMDFATFIMNTHNNVNCLYRQFQTEFNSAFLEVQELFNNKDKYVAKAQQLLACALDSAKFYFNCVLLWVKLKFEKCMDYLGNTLNGENEGSQEVDESSDSSGYQEPHQKVLQQLNALIENDDLQCSTLEEYVNIFDFSCSTVMQNLKDKILDYEKYCKLFKEIDPENGIKNYNHNLGINDDPEEHFLNEVIQKHLNKFYMAKIKSVCSQKRSLCKNFEFLSNVGGEHKLYHYIDKEGSGQFPTQADMLQTICKITNKLVTSETVKIIKDNDVITLLPKTEEMWFNGIFIHCSFTTDNAIIYLVVVM